MVIACWAAKGGSGTTVVAVTLALLAAQRDDQGALLVDLAGDAPAVLGAPDPDSPGVRGWAEAGADVPADALARLALPLRPGLDLLARGEGPPPSRERLELLVAMLAADDRTVVVDCGTLQPDSAVAAVAGGATSSLLVTRPCYLALRRAVAMPLRPSAVVLVSEPGRALDRCDIETVLGAPVAAEVAVDPAVARAVDAGLMASRLPRGLQRSLRDAA